MIGLLSLYPVFLAGVCCVSFEVQALNSGSRALAGYSDQAQFGDSAAASRCSDSCDTPFGLGNHGGAARSPDNANRHVETVSRQSGGGSVHDEVWLGQLVCRHRKGRQRGSSSGEGAGGAVGVSPALPSADGQPLEAAESGAGASILGSFDTCAHPGAEDLQAVEEADGGSAPLASPPASPQADYGSSNWSWTPIKPPLGEDDSDTVDYADDPLALDRMPPGDTSSSADTWLLAQEPLPHYCLAQAAAPQATHEADGHEGGKG